MDDMMIHTNPNTIVENQTADISVVNRLEIIDECVRKKYLARLSEMEIAPFGDLTSLEEWKTGMTQASPPEPAAWPGEFEQL